MKAFVTGAAGFIGFHIASRLLSEGHDVTGYDGLTPYYDVALKRQRLTLLGEHRRFSFVEAMLEDKGALNDAVANFQPEVVVHLAAQAGVRYSITHPQSYLDSNIQGTSSLLEALRQHPPRHLLLASTSSVYGANPDAPFREIARTDFPVSLYAATKKACEALSHAHSNIHGLPTTCFRFFTVYGPWGRPDMALFKFAEAINAGSPIDVYGEGQMKRDFTYIDDLVEAVIRLMDVVPAAGLPIAAEGVVDSLSPVAAWRSVNIAQGEPVPLLRFIDVIEAAMGRRAIRNMMSMQPGDVSTTWADSGLLRALTGYVPSTKIDEGVGRFVGWYEDWRRRKA